MPYYSFSQNIKHKVKSAVSTISDFEENYQKLQLPVILMGLFADTFINLANTWYGNIHYLNSGDWVESLTALIEYPDGGWEIYHHHQDER